MKGRKPQPTQMQVVKGDPAKRGKGKLALRMLSEPKTERGLPECPAHLTGVAKEAWDFWKDALESMQLDCQPDAMTLEAMCMAYARMRAAYAAQDDVQLHKAIRTLASMASEFGLSPVSRTRLTIEKPDNGEQNLHNLLSGPELTAEERARLQ